MEPALLSRYVPGNWAKQSLEAARGRDKLIKVLLEHGNLPAQAWDEETVELFLRQLSMLDSNNFIHHVGAGEREGRIYSSIVSRRCGGLAHGIGRSGDVGANQPKAAGSSTMARLAESMVLDVFRRVLQMRSIRAVLLLPCATGMSLTLVFLALLKREKQRERRIALWTRMDQKTCFKAMESAGLEVRVVENLLVGDAVQCDLAALERALAEDNVALVVSTTSCFAPRVPDDVERIARLCLERNVPHVINNAYGLQCNKCVHQVEAACRTGRVDAVVQSTDKNFMVPVGGCIVASPSAEVVQSVSQTYPGRASSAPIADLFITLLQMGRLGYEQLRKDRIALAMGEFKDMLERVALRNGERVLQSAPRNTISFAMTLTSATAGRDASLFGSMLFTRGVSGARVVKRGAYGSSCEDYPYDYFALACAIGMRAEHVPVLEQRLNETFADWKRA